MKYESKNYRHEYLKFRLLLAISLSPTVVNNLRCSLLLNNRHNKLVYHSSEDRSRLTKIYYLLSAINLSVAEDDICEINEYNSVIYSRQVVVYTCVTRLKFGLQ